MSILEAVKTADGTRICAVNPRSLSFFSRVEITWQDGKQTGLGRYKSALSDVCFMM